MGEPAVAVIDVGKTNKKIHIYNRDLRLIDTRSESIGAAVMDGVSFEATDVLIEWLLENLSRLGSRHDIRAISTSAHGATEACVDENGDLAVPVVDYTHEPGEDFHEEFYRVAGNKNDLQRETATLELKALVNPGKGVYFLKTRFPEQFARVKHILMYAQYFSYRLSGEITADPTYLGCHTYLFDHKTIGYSRVADRLGIRDLLPEVIKDPGEVAGLILPEVAARTGLSPLTRILVGIHDSNASLIPYLVKKPEEDLIVNSTGTWCVAMHPAHDVSFSDDEIGKAVFFNMSALREPVKTTILMGGQEFETYTDILKSRFGLVSFPEFDPDLYRDVVSEADEFIFPSVVRGTGQFPDSSPRVVDHGVTFPLSELQSGAATPPLFRKPERAYAVLNLSLALQTMTALRRVGLRPGSTIYTEGGFRNNRDYNALLATLCPEAAFFLSGMPEATSFGAALLGWAALDELNVRELADRFELAQEKVTPVEVPGLNRYADRFHELMGSPRAPR